MKQQTMARRAANIVALRIQTLDSRGLVAFITLSGLVAWTSPPALLLPFFLLACMCMGVAVCCLPEARGALTVYLGFVALWTLSMLALTLFEHPDSLWEAALRALELGARLFTLLGLAMIMPLNATAVTLGRVLNWYLQWPGCLEAALRQRFGKSHREPLFTRQVWRAGLALTLMMAFFPRALRTLGALRGSLHRRARHLPLQQRLFVMGLAALRILGAQTWAITLSIASRNLYTPGPWTWRAPASSQTRIGLLVQ